MWWFNPDLPITSSQVDPVLQRMRRAIHGLRQNHDFIEWIHLTDDTLLEKAAAVAANVAKELLEEQKNELSLRPEDSPVE